MSKIVTAFMYIHRSLSLTSVLRQTNPVNIWKIISLDTHFNFIISSVPKFLLWSHPIMLPTFSCDLILSCFPPHVISSYHTSHLLMWSHPIMLPTFSCDIILSCFPPKVLISTMHTTWPTHLPCFYHTKSTVVLLFSHFHRLFHLCYVRTSSILLSRPVF
jgi:hypothetical protein